MEKEPDSKDEEPDLKGNFVSELKKGNYFKCTEGLNEARIDDMVIVFTENLKAEYFNPGQYDSFISLATAIIRNIFEPSLLIKCGEILSSTTQTSN